MGPSSKCVVLDCATNTRFTWDLNVNSGIFTGQLSGTSSGWMGIGLTSSSGMLGSDPTIVWGGYAGDYHVGSTRVPVLDAKGDVTLLNSASRGGNLSVAWSRRLTTADTSGQDLAITPGSVQKLVWAMNPSAGSVVNGAPTHHTKKGVLSLDLAAFSTCEGTCGAPRTYDVQRSQCLGVGWTPSQARGDSTGTEYPRLRGTTAPLTSYPGGDQSLCFLMPAFPIPAAPSTTYACRAFALPPTPLHALSFTMMEDNAQFLHHLVAWVSSPDLSKPGDKGLVDLGNGVFDCLDTPPSTGLMYSWAAGAGPLEMPSGTGFPTGRGSGTSYIFIQIHYDNMDGVAGQVDSSGFIMRVTDKSVPIDTGILWTGGVPVPYFGGTIPAGKTAYGLSHSVTFPSNAPPASTVNPLTSSYRVFKAFLHAHLVGKRLWAQTKRNGKVIRDANGVDQLGCDMAFDFSMQKPIDVNATLQPGDTITMHGVFENTVAFGKAVGNPKAAAGQAVVYGEATQEEMNMLFAFYYPKLPAGVLYEAAQLLTTSYNNFCDDTVSSKPKCPTTCTAT